MSHMKILVLIWAVFQMLSLTTSYTNSTTESHTLINSTNLAKPGCNSRCGDLIVPYPFGIGDNPKCYINEGFRIYCDTSVNPPKATINEGDYNSIKLISDSTIRLSNQLASSCCSPNGTIDNFQAWMRFGDRPYSLSKVNKFTVIGCDGSAFLFKLIELNQTLIYGFMHFATSVPIYHRDIKSSNILLDEKFRAKLSDFGISKSVLGDQTHLSTLVKGTFGYLDPEYFQSNQFTEKSDVYSFGIVVLELLTGKKPIYSIGPGESRSLATLILSTDERLLLENVDNRVLDGPEEQLVAVAKLAKRCLNMNGKMRPTMKEVAIELEGIRSSH